MKISDISNFALSLLDVTEEPHHRSSSFRVKGKIFATIPPGDEFLHIMINEEQRELAIVLYPNVYEKLWWGKKVFGVKATLAEANADHVKELLELAWLNKLTKR